METVRSSNNFKCAVEIDNLGDLNIQTLGRFLSLFRIFSDREMPNDCVTYGRIQNKLLIRRSVEKIGILWKA